MHADRSTLNWSLLAAMLLAGCQPEAATSPATAEAGAVRAAGTVAMIPLGGLPSGTCTAQASAAWDVNPSGMIVGDVVCGGTTFPVWWDQALVAHLFPGSIAGQFGHAYAVNASGYAIGTNGLQGLWWANPISFPNSFKVLPTLGGQKSSPRGINDAGEIVGYSDVAGGATHAFYFSGSTGTISDLGTLPGFRHSWASAIAPDGTIVGFSYTGGGVSHAVSWDANHTIHDLGTLAASGQTEANDINAFHDIIGTSSPLSGPDLAFLLLHGSTSLIPLPPPTAGGVSAANGINDVGAIVGTADFSIGSFGALRQAGSTKWKMLTRLPGYGSSSAYAVDQTCGRIVGYAINTTTGRAQAVLWTGYPC